MGPAGDTFQAYRLFLASPGDVSAERETVSQVVDEMNQTHGPALGYSLELLRWETHAAPAGGRPQGVINEQLGDYDLFVGIMWRRFGTPSGVAGSGTEEEYRRAYAAWEKNNEMPLMFYFCQKPFMPRQVEEIDQIRQVLLFRQELERKALVWDYAGSESFAGDIRKHLCLRMTRMVEDAGKPQRFRAVPNDQSIAEFRDLWRSMSPELRNAFSVAYNENRRAGDPGIQTRDLFAALLRVTGNQLTPIVEEIPAAALPAPVQGAIAEQPYIVEERPWLSHCVASSIKRLRRLLPDGRELSAADIFSDIARNGTGQSVALLRQHNIGPEQIDQILRRKHVHVLETGGGH